MYIWKTTPQVCPQAGRGTVTLSMSDEVAGATDLQVVKPPPCSPECRRRLLRKTREPPTG